MLDQGTARFDRLLDEAAARGLFDEINRLETWLWLDGPARPEGRVGGEERARALEMNGIALKSGVPEDAGKSGIDAWSGLGEVRVPVTVACGDLDVPFLVERCETSTSPAERYPPLEGVAHLSELEQPGMVVALLNGLLGLV